MTVLGSQGAVASWVDTRRGTPAAAAGGVDDRSNGVIRTVGKSTRGEDMPRVPDALQGVIQPQPCTQGLYLHLSPT